MRKTLALVAISALFASLAACGGGEVPEAKTPETPASPEAPATPEAPAPEEAAPEEAPAEAPAEAPPAEAAPEGG